MIDAVLGLHMNPLTCGVAKYNHALAKRLGVPYEPTTRSYNHVHPLYSLKSSEIAYGNIDIGPRPRGTYDVLWHDRGEAPGTKRFTQYAARVFYADDIGCPATIEGNPDRGSIDVLCFGMSHKFLTPRFQCLKALLDATGEDYTVSLSTGIHEGTPWDVGFTANMALMRDIFGSHLRCLGFLADDGLARELRHVQVAALFFDPAVRANNTSLWAALEAGVPTITNLDAHSPKELQHHVSVYDLDQLSEFPREAARHREVRFGGSKAAQAYNWDHLLSVLHA